MIFFHLFPPYDLLEFFDIWNAEKILPLTVFPQDTKLEFT